MNLLELVRSVTTAPWLYPFACLVGAAVMALGGVRLARPRSNFLPNITGAALLALGLFLFGTAGLAQVTTAAMYDVKPPTTTELGNADDAQYMRLGDTLYIFGGAMGLIAMACLVLSLMLLLDKSVNTRAWSPAGLAVTVIVATASLRTFEHAKTAYDRIDDPGAHYYVALWIHWVLFAVIAALTALSVVRLLRLWRSRPRNNQKVYPGSDPFLGTYWTP